MRAVDIIIKKRDHEVLTREEIEFFVDGFSKNQIPDYQVSAWAMAVLLNGMTDQETTDLTMAMVRSGEVLDFTNVVDFVVDKHSTGGVGDKTTLVVAPIVAACGLPVGKMSGRGLGFSGGTLDKMESIPGYRVDLTREEFMKQLKETGIVLSGQSADLAPADGKLYALRDVTGTVPSMPLIASSVMSKKIAAGANAILLDVKTGVGAFMETEEDARKLAELMVAIGKLSNRKVIGLISDMNQPLGCAVGNALEVQEAIDALHGEGPDDFMEHCLVVSSYMLLLANMAESLDDAREMCEVAIADGSAFEMFKKLVATQGGDLSYVDQPEKLPKAKLVAEIKAEEDGFVQQVNAREIGETSVELGAGRAKKGDPVDHAVGIMVHSKVGDAVKAGDILATIHANDPAKLAAAVARVKDAYVLGKEACEPLPLFYGVIE